MKRNTWNVTMLAMATLIISTASAWAGDVVAVQKSNSGDIVVPEQIELTEGQVRLRIRFLERFGDLVQCQPGTLCAKYKLRKRFKNKMCAFPGLTAETAAALGCGEDGIPLPQDVIASE